MNEFTASNGVRVRRTSGGTLAISVIHFTASEENALREFFQREADERLGRWRWPENPDYVVYPTVADTVTRRQARGVTVLSETIPRPYTVWEDNVDVLYGTSTDEGSRQQARAAAKAYFEAHPERKPWEDAKEGDVWIITPSKAITLGERVEYPAIFQAGRFRDHGGSWEARDITDARRIWPGVVVDGYPDF